MFYMRGGETSGMKRKRLRACFTVSSICSETHGPVELWPQHVKGLFRPSICKDGGRVKEIMLTLFSEAWRRVLSSVEGTQTSDCFLFIC